MEKFQFADIHCHPNLKSFGQTFSKRKSVRAKKGTMWFKKKPRWNTILIQKVLGITRFSQADMQTMIDGNIKLAFVSLYPFEKGFFKGAILSPKISAVLSNIVTSIGYNRVLHIQNHKNYYEDFKAEYQFLLNDKRTNKINGTTYSFEFYNKSSNIETEVKNEASLIIIPTIEGGHILNSGLSKYGKPINEKEVIDNVYRLKHLSNPPLFITFAHNFNNDLCGHAPSLETLGRLVDQSNNLDKGFSELGYKVVAAMLEKNIGPQIYIDIKHMSLLARKQYYTFLDENYDNNVPIIASHAAVTGRDFNGNINSSINVSCFANDSINLYDEELVIIAKSKGLIGIQLDAKRLAPKALIKKPLFRYNNKKAIKKSALIVWRQIRHIAEVLDSHGLPSWETCCIGSDFDGTIDPLDGIWTAANFNDLANELLVYAHEYLEQPNVLDLELNKNISALELVKNIAINNVTSFLSAYYHKIN